MKRISLIISVSLALFIFPHQSFGQHAFPEHETYRQRTVEKKTGILLSQLTGNFKKIDDNHYMLIKSGKGSYSKFQDVNWTIESKAELKEKLLCPIYTILSIKNRKNQKISIWKKEYNQENKSIQVTQKNVNDKIIKKLNFPLEDRTTDYATLVYFLRPFINDILERKTIRFNFLSSEPGLYKLKACFATEDKLLIGSKEIEAIKIAIRPDMGAFNIILDRFVPPTLLWYEKKSPHLWLKYEGLESGRGSAHIITTIEKEY